MKKRIASFLMRILDVKREDIPEEKNKEIEEVEALKEEPVIKNNKKSSLKKVVVDDFVSDESFKEMKPLFKTTKIKKVTKQNKTKAKELTSKEKAERDLTEMMEVPFLALSKNRKKPILYEKRNGENTMKVKVSAHSEHYIASIYDWDIILFVAGRIQKILNEGADIPPKKMIVPRHEILKALKKHDGKKEELDLRAALSRLQLTGIETTIRNETGKYGAGFGFLDSWGYTERKDVREIWINLSDWLYEGICAKGSLLMVDPDYFSLTSGLKRFLYRTARKHAGINGGSWEFLLKTLYEKSGSEQEFKMFKRDLKKAVSDNDIPGYLLRWDERDGKIYISFKNIKIPTDENFLG
jgi:plasmid replication initiation protein